jgi:hypothetical protein
MFTSIQQNIHELAPLLSSTWALLLLAKLTMNGEWTHYTIVLIQRMQAEGRSNNLQTYQRANEVFSPEVDLLHVYTVVLPAI